MNSSALLSIMFFSFREQMQSKGQRLHRIINVPV
ncbi:hypothetical protein V6Z12_D05G180000 [Gossypium hirsutum]